VCLGATYIQIDAPHYGCRATTRRFQPVPHKRFECGDQGASRPTMPSRPGRPGQLSWRPRVLLGGGGGISSGSRRSASADGRGCPGGSYSGSGDSGVQGSFARRCPSFAERPVRLGARREGPRLIMVEGKVSESFGPTLGEWRGDASHGKESRLRFLQRTLGLMENPAGSIRYQLLHRAASSVITGEQFRAAAAVMLVHSFSEQHVGWSDYQSFAALFGVDAIEGVVHRLGRDSRIPLFGVWLWVTVRSWEVEAELLDLGCGARVAAAVPRFSPPGKSTGICHPAPCPGRATYSPASTHKTHLSERLRRQEERPLPAICNPLPKPDLT